MPDLVVHGARLHYEDAGPLGSPEGRAPVLFSHGFLWSGAMFSAQARALSVTRRCVRYDHRGQGSSEVTAAGYDMDTLADDAAALIEALGLAPVHFVGLSMGGFVGLRLARYRPALLRSLTLIASAADEEPAQNAPKYRALGHAVRLLGAGPLVPRLLPIMFGQSFLADRTRAAERATYEAQLRGIDTRGALRALEGVLTRRSVLHLCPAITTPTLLLSGDEDRAVPPARMARTAALLANARLEHVPAAGHSASMEAPDAVSAALARFFDAVEAGAARP